LQVILRFALEVSQTNIRPWVPPPINAAGSDGRRNTGPTPDEAVRIARQIDALEYAHERGTKVCSL